MTHNDAASELESPPEAIASFYPRFMAACALGAAALRRDGNRKRGDLVECTRCIHLNRIFDASGAKSVNEVVERLDGGKA